MPEAVWLQSGPLRAAIRPDLGGCLAGLWWHDRPVLRSTDPLALDRVRASAVYPLAPYSNRLGWRRFVWQGQTYTTRANFENSPHSLHGVAWQRGWTVPSRQSHQALLSMRHRPDGDWPFAFNLQQQISLNDDGLEMQLACTSEDERPQPMGLGWHPFFPRRARSQLSFRASHRWDPDVNELPVAATPVDGIDEPVAALQLDHCFDGWTGEVALDDECFSLRLGSSCRRLVVFTPAAAAHFCVEPVSHVSNALQADDPLGRGMVALAPGACIEAGLRLRISPVPSNITG